MFRFDYVFLSTLIPKIRADAKDGKTHFMQLLFRILDDPADVQDLKLEFSRYRINLHMVPTDFTAPRGDPRKPVELNPEGVEDVRGKLKRLSAEQTKELVYSTAYLVLAFKAERDQKIVADALGIEVTKKFQDENNETHTVQ